MEAQPEITQNISSLKLPMLKTGDYDLWSMRMEQYLTHTDYALWKLIINGDSPVPDLPAVGTVVPLKTKAQKVARKNELKAKTIKTRFGGNKESKKMHKTIMKQQYENFVASRSEGLDKTYDRFQKLISQLELNGEVILHEDANMKLLMSLLSAWNNIALIIRNKPDIETFSMDDLYNNLKVYEAEIKGQSSSSSNSHNVAFVSFENTSNINEAVNVAQDILAAGSKEQPSVSSYADDGNRSSDNERRIVPVETPASALVVQDGLGGYNWSYQAEEGTTDFALMAHASDQLSENEMPKCEIFEAVSDSSVSEIDEDNNQAKDSVNHLIKDCTFYKNKMVEKSMVNNKGKVATKSGQVLVNAAKQNSTTSTSTARPKVNTAAIRPNVNAKSFYFKPHFPKRKHFNQRSTAKTNTFSRKNNTAKGKNVTTAGPKAVVNAAEGKKENVVKSSACWIWRPKGKLIDHPSKDSGSYTLKRFNYVDPNGRLKMRYEKPSDKLTFYKAFFSPQWKFLIHSILQCLSAKTTSWNEFNSTMASTIICLATNQKFNFSRFVQLIINHQLGDITHHKDIFATSSLTKKVFANMKRVGTGFSREVTPLFANMLVQALEEVAEQNIPLPSPSHDPLPSGEDSLKLKELMDFCTNLSKKVIDLESEVIDIKSTHQARIQKLESRVERLEEENRVLKELKSVHSKVDSYEPIMEIKKSSKQERKIADIDADVLSMMDANDEEPTDVDEVLEVVKAAKLITKVVTTARVDVNTASIQDTLIIAAEATKVSVLRKRRGVIIQDPKETTKTVTMQPKVQAKDKGKTILIEEPKPLKRQAQIKLDEEVNEGVKVPKKEVSQEKEVKVESSKREGESLEQEIAKKQKMEQETEELKKYLQIVPNDDDDVYTDATPLALKIPIINYKIHTERNIPYFKIIRADGNHILFLSFSTMLKNFDREDLEFLWNIVKERFAKTEPKNYSDDFLLNTLKIMFEKPNVEANIFLLIERMYPLTHFTLEQMMNDVRLEVEDESEISLELLRLVRR
nr:hypothetical protein [Tanacetum cinerariifolium]